MKKIKNKKFVLTRLWRYLSHYKALLFTAVILTLASNLLALAGPMLSGWAIDAIEPGPGAVLFRQVFFFCAMMLLFYVVSSLLSYILSILMIHLSQKTVFHMRKDLFDKLLDLPVGFFDQYQTGDIISRISYDIDTVNASLSSDLLQICTSFITVAGSFFGMLYLSPPLMLIFVVTIPATIIFTKKRTNKVRPLFRRRSKMLGELNGFIEEIISGQKTTKAYHQEQTMIGRFDKINKAAVDAYYDADYYGSTVGPSVNFINNISMALVSTVGAALYLFEMLTLGDVSAFILYSRKFSGPINEMANILSELQSAFAAAERVFSMMDQIPEKADIPGAFTLEEAKGEVALSHVRFGYEPEHPIIHDLNLKAAPGSLIAIVGPTGAGKTTLINLLMRFYDPDSGQIFVDGHDIETLSRKSLRLAYTMVLQDTWLFHGTIFENIAYGAENAQMEDVTAAAKAVHIHDYILSLPNGYDTLLSDDGVNISKGQKQLLTIARAILAPSRMLILDEATSNVDTRTELQIQEAMQKLMEGKTSFVIAHRLSTIQNADLILVINHGDIVEQGTHTQLLQKKGVYADLYHSQFS